MTSRLVRLVALAVTLVVAGRSSAGAADEIGLSLDGVHWSSSITAPLFDPSVHWVPGDTQTATFYVLNRGGTPADLTVDLLDPGAQDLLDSGDLHVTATGGGGTWEVVSQGGQHRLLTRPDLADGESAPIDVTVAFDADSTNATQVQSAELVFRITLSEAVNGGTDGGSGEGGDGSNLPGTGSPQPHWLVMLGAGLVMAGLALVVRRRGEPTHV